MSNFVLNDDLKNKIEKIISDYNGGEIFFGCKFDDEEKIIDIEPVCYGNENAVLAPYEIASRYNAILHNHPGNNLMPSENDLNYASYLSREGIGFFIINNKATNINVIVPPIFLKKHKKIDQALIENFFITNGSLNKLKEDFEFREGQLKMSLKVNEALNNNEISVIEAGTGIGKSLAYLIPAFLWAELNQERIIISTNTINLQNQLVNKDIPIVKKILNSKIEPVIVKGRRNYLCKLKIYNLQNELAFDEEKEEINSILKWSSISDKGIIDELSFIPSNGVWERVSSDVDFCLGRNCIFFKNCFFQISRRRSSESNILIVNHHILMADVDLRSQGKGLEENILLPPYRKIIFDEAHNIINSASSFFSITFSKTSFYRFLGFIRKRNNRGFLNRFLEKLKNSEFDDSDNLSDFISKEVLGIFSVLFNESFDIFSDINIYLIKIIENANNKDSMRNIQYRIKKDEWNSFEFKEKIIKNLIKLKLLSEKVEESFDELFFKLQDCSDDFKNYFEIDTKLVKSYQLKFKSIIEQFNKLVDIDIEKYVVWFDINRDVSDIIFKFIATPLSLDEILCNNIYRVFDSIIFTSATVTVNNTFDFFKLTTGLKLLQDRIILESIFDSPFNYKENVVLIAPRDIPEPFDNKYNEKLNEFLKETIKLMGGSSFVLFTSYEQLKKSFNTVNPYLSEIGLRCFYQGEMERTKLLEKFITEVESSLFATNSFWEGVDAPGKTLRYVVLAKLPFSIPTDPVEEARLEDMEKKGINSFVSYSLPQAVIKFRQGFGRLIRRKDDYGVVAILDSRILKKFYGKIFIQSLPDCRIIQGKLENILIDMKDHINKFENSAAKL